MTRCNFSVKMSVLLAPWSIDIRLPSADPRERDLLINTHTPCTTSFRWWDKKRVPPWAHQLSIALSFPQWGAADAEIKVLSGESTELKCSSFKVWSRSVYSHTSYTDCQRFLPWWFRSFQSIHLHFFPKPLPSFSCVVANTTSCVGPQNKIGHPAGCRFPCWVPAEYEKAWKLCWCSEIVDRIWYLVWEKATCGKNDLCNESGNQLKFIFSPDVILCGWVGSNKMWHQKFSLQHQEVLTPMKH